jgi:DNA-directed RNA polymerase specialized sigma subunit
VESKYYNDKAYVDISKLLDEEDKELHREYKKVIGKNYDPDKAWELLQKQKDRDLALVKKARAGDIEARNYLYIKHLPAIKDILKSIKHIKPLDFNDKLHDCFFIVMLAIDEFDEKKNDNFLRFCKMFIPQRIINNYKSKKNRYETIQHDNIDDFDENNPFMTLPPSMQSNEKEYELT